MDHQKDMWEECDILGEEEVRRRVNTKIYSGHNKVLAEAWLAEREADAESASREAVITSARAANALARDANDLASSANSIAARALSWAAANFGIAVVAVIMAAIALAVSLFK